MVSEAKLRSLISEWEKTEFTIRETRFQIQALNAMEAFDISEDIRESVGPRSLGLLGGSKDDLVILAGLMLSMPKNHLGAIRQKLFAHILFTNSVNHDPTPLFPDENMGFMGLLPLHIYEVLLRSFAVNFTESFSELNSRIEAVGLKVTPPPSP